MAVSIDTFDLESGYAWNISLSADLLPLDRYSSKAQKRLYKFIANTSVGRSLASKQEK
jgi:hypothetical protein